MARNAHAAANLQLIRDLEETQEWYECHNCGAEYRSKMARVMCCSDGVREEGGDVA